MTKRIPVERLNFDFPDGWEAGKYDDWKFYRNNFCTMFDGIKAVDILAVAPDETAYLIEVKEPAERYCRRALPESCRNFSRPSAREPPGGRSRRAEDADIQSFSSTDQPGVHPAKTQAQNMADRCIPVGRLDQPSAERGMVSSGSIPPRHASNVNSAHTLSA